MTSNTSGNDGDRKNQLGFALQLCAFRFPGRLLKSGEVIPEDVSRFIAAQLGLKPDDLLPYAVREETRREHLVALRRIYGYRMFKGKRVRRMKSWLAEHAEAAGSGEDLVRGFVEECRRRLVILPAMSTIERLCADALVAAERRIDARIAARLDGWMRTRLDSLLSESADGHTSRFIWLRQFEVGNNSADAIREGGLTHSGCQYIIAPMDDAAALAEIRHAAQAALDAWPEARAAVLFGSRARGNHRADSDWDVAFILDGDGERIGSIPSGIPFSVPGVRRSHYVNEIAIPERLVARKALCIGHIGRGIAVDGRILAGNWTKPQLEGRPFMEAEKYKGSVRNSLLMVWKACDALARLSEDWDIARGRADDLVASTADAAEHLAKAAMGRHGLDAYQVHSLDKLAGQARKAGLHALAEDVLGMNGATGHDHVARYEGATGESVAHAIARLPVVLEFMRTELDGLPDEFPDPVAKQKLMESAAKIFSEGAATLLNAVERDGADLEPPEPHGWLKPLVAFRGALAAKLDATADTLRKGGKRAGNDDAHLPTPSPIEDLTNPFKM